VADAGHHVNLQAHTPVPEGLTEESLRRLVSHVLGQEGVNEQWTIGFRFTTDRDIQHLHHEFMDLDSPTDIMTFPYGHTEDAAFAAIDGSIVGGDIVISADRASAQAVDAGWTTLDELWFLAIHGMLHLAGWEDHEDEARDAMLERQSELLQEWKAIHYREMGTGISTG